MPTPPPRKRFQIHLSTAMVMMIVAGALIWANTRVRHETKPTSLMGDVCDIEYSFYGWPVSGIMDEFEFRFYHKGTADLKPPWPLSRIGTITFNSLFALVVIAFVWFLCEWLIRRRAARKGT